MASKTFKGSHVEHRYNTYFAVLYIPKDVRHIFGRTKFYKTTETSDLRLAERRASAFVLGWKAQIAAARSESEDPVIKSALDLANNLKHSSSVQTVREIIDEQEESIRVQKGQLYADVFKDIATGKQRLLKELIQPWKDQQKQRGLAQKTIDQMANDIGLMTLTFPTANTLLKDYISIWITKTLVTGGLSASSINRIIGSCRNFFKYLQMLGEVSKDVQTPFFVPDELKISNKPNAKCVNRSETWLPFTSTEVVTIYKTAKDKGDQVLADLIFIGAYTGARIEELCSIQIPDINLFHDKISINDAKTAASQRVIPIHSKIKPRLEELMRCSTDGYIFSELTFNKYNDRSNAVGKRFGRLKKSLGYSKRHVFHSIRKTLTTQLENAGVLENIAADIVGHEKPRITYGLYSGGATLEVMREAIERVSYNFESISR